MKYDYCYCIYCLFFTCKFAIVFIIDYSLFLIFYLFPLLSLFFDLLIEISLECSSVNLVVLILSVLVHNFSNHFFFSLISNFSLRSLQRVHKDVNFLVQLAQIDFHVFFLPLIVLCFFVSMVVLGMSISSFFNVFVFRFNFSHGSLDILVSLPAIELVTNSLI